MRANDEATRELIEAIANVVIAHTRELAELDRAIGDADHGVNLERGFKAVLERMDIIAVMPLGKALSEVGLTLIRFVGGASGPLCGKLFGTIGRHLEGARVPSRGPFGGAGAGRCRRLKARRRWRGGQNHDRALPAARAHE